MKADAKAAGGTPEGEAKGQAPGTPPANPDEKRVAATYAPDADAPTFERPKSVRGIYMTAWSAASPRKRQQMLALLDKTELNALVIDVRDAGEMYWPTGIKVADETQGKRFLAVQNPTKLMKELATRKAYPIARIACFRDNYLAKKHPERYVQRANGTVWRDRAGYGWLDPYNKANWDYLAETVDYAMDVGFPEIQLDYVRFPSEGKVSSMVFPARKSYEDPKARPGDVIAAFCEYVRERVKARDRVFSADIFGIISSGKIDQGIGQDLETIAKPFDLVCPMVYPSHFALGEYGIKDPDRSPYEIVKKSLADYKRRVPEKAVRPWLQDFSLRNRYGAAEVRAQIKAAQELGYDEYLLWNAANRYTTGALGKPE